MSKVRESGGGAPGSDPVHLSSASDGDGGFRLLHSQLESRCFLMVPSLCVCVCEDERRSQNGGSSKKEKWRRRRFKEGEMPSSRPGGAMRFQLKESPALTADGLSSPTSKIPQSQS